MASKYLFAIHCLRAAEKAADPNTKLLFLDMAMAWRKLSRQAEKNSRLDLVYEPAQRGPGHLVTSRGKMEEAQP